MKMNKLILVPSNALMKLNNNQTISKKDKLEETQIVCSGINLCYFWLQ